MQRADKNAKPHTAKRTPHTKKKREIKNDELFFL